MCLGSSILILQFTKYFFRHYYIMDLLTGAILWKFADDFCWLSSNHCFSESFVVLGYQVPISIPDNYQMAVISKKDWTTKLSKCYNHDIRVDQYNYIVLNFSSKTALVISGGAPRCDSLFSVQGTCAFQCGNIRRQTFVRSRQLE